MTDRLISYSCTTSWLDGIQSETVLSQWLIGTEPRLATGDTSSSDSHPKAPATCAASASFQLTSPPASTPPSLEPILFPKLRIYFADFPYSHSSLNYRLLTLETCCGLGTDTRRRFLCQLAFSEDSGVHSMHRKSAHSDASNSAYLGTSPFQVGLCVKKKR